jgi:hypothetical protein
MLLRLIFRRLWPLASVHQSRRSQKKVNFLGVYSLKAGSKQLAINAT